MAPVGRVLAAKHGLWRLRGFVLRERRISGKVYECQKVARATALFRLL